jgi:hypothetical protein
MRTTIDTRSKNRKYRTSLDIRRVKSRSQRSAVSQFRIHESSRTLGRSQSRTASFCSRPDQQQPDAVLLLLADEHLHLDPRGPPSRAASRAVAGSVGHPPPPVALVATSTSLVKAGPTPAFVLGAGIAAGERRGCL